MRDLSELPLTVLQGFHPAIEKDVYSAEPARLAQRAQHAGGGTAPAQVRATRSPPRTPGLRAACPPS